MIDPVESMRMATEMWQTSLAAATTIGARMPILFSAAMTGSPNSLRESQRMVSEKMTAAMDGAMAAGTAAMRLWLQAAGNSAVPSATAWAKVAEAAWQPAQRTCRANALRLSGRRRKRK